MEEQQRPQKHVEREGKDDWPVIRCEGGKAGLEALQKVRQPVTFFVACFTGWASFKLLTKALWRLNLYCVTNDSAALGSNGEASAY